jgi:hypothetical protein
MIGKVLNSYRSRGCRIQLQHRKTDTRFRDMPSSVEVDRRVSPPYGRSCEDDVGAARLPTLG